MSWINVSIRSDDCVAVVYFVMQDMYNFPSNIGMRVFVARKYAELIDSSSDWSWISSFLHDDEIVEDLYNNTRYAIKHTGFLDLELPDFDNAVVTAELDKITFELSV